MLHVGLDLSRRRLAFACSTGTASWSRRPRRPRTPMVARLGAALGEAPGAGGDRVDERRAVRARLLEERGWEVLIADAQKVKGLAPLACETDKIDARVLAELSGAIWCRRSGCLTRASAASAS